MNSKMDDGLKSRSTKVSEITLSGFSRSELKLLIMGLTALIFDLVWANEKEKITLEGILNRIKKSYGK